MGENNSARVSARVSEMSGSGRVSRGYGSGNVPSGWIRSNARRNNGGPAGMARRDSAARPVRIWRRKARRSQRGAPPPPSC